MNIFERVEVDNSLFEIIDNDRPKTKLFTLSWLWQKNNVPHNHIDNPIQKYIGREVDINGTYQDNAISYIEDWDKLNLKSQIIGDNSRAYYSAIYELNLLNNLINFRDIFSDEIKILDIGGGYSRIAPFFNALFKKITYVNIDLCTTSIISSKSFLKHNLQDKDVYLITNKNEKIDKIGFYIIPMWYYEIIPNECFDLILNINSMQEMTQIQIDFYLQFINNVSKNNSYFFFRNHIGRIKDIDGSKLTYKFPNNWKNLYDASEKYFDSWSNVINKLFKIVKTV